MTNSLQSRKRQLVQDAIYDAAIDLFSMNGFDETTVEEVAEAAGISRRSFFRYFASKDDLLALNTVHCGQILIQAITSSPSDLASIEVVRRVVMAGIKFTEKQPHTRQIIEIAARSVSARQAHLSRLMEVQDKLALAFAGRLKGGSQYLQSHLLAGLCLLALNNATASWFQREHKDLLTAARQAFANLERWFSHGPATPRRGRSASIRNLTAVKGKRVHPRK